jgi:hypothetical protein
VSVCLLACTQFLMLVCVQRVMELLHGRAEEYTLHFH